MGASTFIASTASWISSPAPGHAANAPTSRSRSRSTTAVRCPRAPSMVCPLPVLAKSREISNASMARGPRLLDGEPDGRRLRVGERHLRHDAEVGPIRTARRRSGGDPAFVVGDVRELQATRHISGHEQAVGDAHLVVGRGRSPVVKRCAGVLGAQRAEVRGSPPDRHQELGALHGRTIRELDDPPGAAGPDPSGRDPKAELETFLHELVGDVLRRERMVTRQDPVAALDERDADPEPDEDLRHLHPDHAPTQDHQARRKLARRRRLPTGPVRHLVDAGDRRHERCRSGGDDDARCPERLDVARGCPHLDRAGADDPRLAADHPGAGRLHAPDVAVIVRIVDHLSRDHPVTARGGTRPVVVRPAGALGRGVQQGLGRHARPERARAADQIPFHEHGGRADRGRGEAGGLSRGAPTDHDDVLVHGSPFVGRHARRRSSSSRRVLEARRLAVVAEDARER